MKLISNLVYQTGLRRKDRISVLLLLVWAKRISTLLVMAFGACLFIVVGRLVIGLANGP